MALQDILDECVSVTLGVAGAGHVRDWEALDFSEPAVVSNFVSLGEVNAVEIIRRSTPATNFANAKAQFDHEIMFNIYRGARIANPMVSSRDHVAFTEAIVDAFRPLYRLNGNATRVLPMAIEFNAYTEKAGNLWHYAIGILNVREDRQ